MAFHVELENIDPGTNVQLVVSHEDKVIWETRVLKGNANMEIVVGSMGKVTFKMIYVDGGTFDMGDNGFGNPTHKVTLSPFYIAETVVTQALWELE